MARNSRAPGMGRSDDPRMREVQESVRHLRGKVGEVEAASAIASPPTASGLNKYAGRGQVKALEKRALEFQSSVGWSNSATAQLAGKYVMAVHHWKEAMEILESPYPNVQTMQRLLAKGDALRDEVKKQLERQAYSREMTAIQDL